MNPILVYPKSFPATPRMNFRIVANWMTRVFGIGFAFPRVSLHHSCFTILIVAAPGVIKSAIPAGIFVTHVPAMLVQAFAWTCWRHKRINYAKASLIRVACASINEHPCIATQTENLP